VSERGLNTRYFSENKGRALTGPEFERSLDLTAEQRRLADDLVSEVQTTLGKRKAAPTGRGAAKRAKSKGRRSR
jgi:hypothetical protein